jgi:hypothetical protein
LGEFFVAVNLKYRAAIANVEKPLQVLQQVIIFFAAQYFYQSNDNKARSYVDKALELSTEKPFYYLRLKSLIQAKQGDKRSH